MADEVSTPRAEYVDRVDEWRLMRDSIRGESAIKAAEDFYLPMPSGFSVAEAPAGLWGAYLNRAQYPGIVVQTRSGMDGVITRKEIKIEMPESMEGLWESATPDKQPLEALYRTIVKELLDVGRFGLLVDGKTEGTDLPWIATYKAETIINWSEDRDFYVLDETRPERDGFIWEDVRKFRVLEMVDGVYNVTIWEDGEPVFEVVDGKQQEVIPLVPGDPLQPEGRGERKFEEVPFVIIGTRGLAVDPDDPPLLAVARSAIAMYQLSADYRYQLFMTGLENLVIINAEPPKAVGAGIIIKLMAGDEKLTPDAKYVSPTCSGIAAHRQAIADERENAISAGAKLFESGTKAAESGEALNIRYTAQTATLVSIAQAAAAGLERVLRYVAVMIGADPEEVVVTPDLSFVQSVMTPDEAVKLMELWTGGSGGVPAISYETLYENLQRGKIASDERDAEEERKLIDDENIDMGPSEEELAALQMQQQQQQERLKPPVDDRQLLPEAA